MTYLTGSYGLSKMMPANNSAKFMALIWVNKALQFYNNITHTPSHLAYF